MFVVVSNLDKEWIIYAILMCILLRVVKSLHMVVHANEFKNIGFEKIVYIDIERNKPIVVEYVDNSKHVILIEKWLYKLLFE